MSVLSIFKRDESAPAAEAVDLSALLVDLQRYGKPSVRLMRDGWYCGVDMNTTAAGASFEVRSDFTHKSPIEAALACRGRVLAALSAMKAIT